MGYYIGIIHKDEDSDFGISFPDFPGCVSAGSTLDEVSVMGREALAAHVSLMAEDREPIPEPSPIEAVMQDPDNCDGTPVLIPAPPATGKTIRVNITLPDPDLRQIDSFAEKHGLTRSGFLLMAAQRFIESGLIA